MKIDELKPLPTEKVQFKLVEYKSVPKVDGCYVLTTFDNHILYIGLSNNLHERFKQHLANPEKTKPTKDGKAIWFYFISYDKKNLPQLERSWLNQYNLVHGKRPVLNKVDSPIS
jgi:excinuclease UvrABC nuclease subunit